MSEVESHALLQTVPLGYGPDFGYPPALVLDWPGSTFPGDHRQPSITLRKGEFHDEAARPFAPRDFDGPIGISS